jgi:hypothetical protein
MYKVPDKDMRNYKRIVEQISFLVGLNYVLAEAEKEGYNVTLDCSHTQKKGSHDQIKWSGDNFSLSLNYEISYGLLYSYILANKDKIIKMIVNSDEIYSINREVIIYVPPETNTYALKKIFHTVIDVQYDE